MFLYYLKEKFESLSPVSLFRPASQPPTPSANVETYPKIETTFAIDLPNFNVKQLPATEHAQLGRAIDGCSLRLVLS